MSITTEQQVDRDALRDAAVREEFIEKVGLIAQGDGMPRIAGRLFGLLLFDKGPYSFSELARQLKVSRGSISSSAQRLEDLGVIQRVTKPGDRQDYFRLADVPYATLLHRVADRAGKAKTEIERTIGQLSPGLTDVRKRLEEYSAFYGVMEKSVNEAAGELNKNR